MLRPNLSPPIYLAGAGSDKLPQATVDLAKRAALPVGGLVAGAVIGAVAAYFVPRVLDRVLEAHQSPTVELETDEE